ncbi:hypothetical protein ASG06_07145 [Rathayibacter sp. Leaf185]|nr:hypothetical protein ASF42_07145 [Rathayibacter sp. Leaf294]KQS14133.1 hypothetical protein ASG06_07145 [Rathayibacter sp. Leaf185]
MVTPDDRRVLQAVELVQRLERDLADAERAARASGSRTTSTLDRLRRDLQAARASLQAARRG